MVHSRLPIANNTVDMLKEKLKLADELCEYILENMRLSSCNKDALCTLILKFNAIEIVGESYEEKVRIIRNMKKPELIDDQKVQAKRSENYGLCFLGQ